MFSDGYDNPRSARNGDFLCSEVVAEVEQSRVVGVVLFELAFVRHADVGVAADFERHARAQFDAEAVHVFTVGHIA